MTHKTKQLSSFSTLVACNWQWFRAPLLGIFPYFSVILFLSLSLSRNSSHLPLMPEWWLLSAGRPFCKCCRSLWSGSCACGAAKEEAMMKRERDPAAGAGEGRVQCGERGTGSGEWCIKSEKKGERREWNERVLTVTTLADQSPHVPFKT